jgi:hypothetical protein
MDMELHIIVDGEIVSRLHPAPDAQLVVGRAGDCDIMLEDGLVSRRHARIWCDAGTWRIEDLGSRNNTRINGKKVGAAALADGDLVSIGRARIEVVDAVGASAPGPRLEAVAGPCAGRVEPLDRAWFALGTTGAELAVVTAHEGTHAVRGIEGFGERLTLNGEPLDGEERTLAEGDCLRVGDGEWVFHAG